MSGGSGRTALVVLAMAAMGVGLFAVSYVLEHGSPLTMGALAAALGSALIVLAFSYGTEHGFRSLLRDEDQMTGRAARKVGLLDVQERRGSLNLPPPPLHDKLAKTSREVFFIGYYGDRLLRENEGALKDALSSGATVALLLLHPDTQEQANQTEKRDASRQLDTTLGLIQRWLKASPEWKGRIVVRGHRGHLYATGLLLDCGVLDSEAKHPRRGLIRFQPKMNFVSQSEGILLTVDPRSQLAQDFWESARSLWAQAEPIPLTTTFTMVAQP